MIGIRTPAPTYRMQYHTNGVRFTDINLKFTIVDYMVLHLCKGRLHDICI